MSDAEAFENVNKHPAQMSKATSRVANRGNGLATDISLYVAWIK